MYILETKNLTKRFDGVKAIDKLSISIEKGTITGVIGPNGSGKTTLLHLLSGLLPIDEGVITINKKQFSDVKSPHTVFYEGIARTFQDIRLFEQLSVLDNILIMLTQRNVFKALLEKTIDDHYHIAEKALSKVGLWNKRDEPAINLSYGQRKLLELARILTTDAEIYLFDEPFAGLYPAMKKIVKAIIRDLKKNEKTIVLVEHDIELIKSIADFIVVLDSGQLLAHGKPDEVLNKRTVIEAYLGS